MREWHRYNPDTVFFGSDGNGVRYLPEFLQDYQNTFNEIPEAGCHKCLKRYFTRLIQKQESEMNTQKSSFRLKKMFEGIQAKFGSSKMFRNSTLTDEDAIFLLDNHPHGVKLFDVIPSNVDEIRSGLNQGTQDTDQDISKMKKDDLLQVAEEMGIEIPEKATKAVLISLIQEAQSEQ